MTKQAPQTQRREQRQAPRAQPSFQQPPFRQPKNPWSPLEIASAEHFIPDDRYRESYEIVHFQSLAEGYSYTTLAVVADGLGVNPQASREASKIVVKAIVERFTQSKAHVKDLFIEGFSTAAQKIAQDEIETMSYPHPQKAVDHLVSKWWKDKNPTVILLKVS